MTATAEIDRDTHLATEPLAALHAELDAEHLAHAASFDAGLADHLPMLRHAKFALGASAAQRASMAAAFQTRLAPMLADEAERVARWSAALALRGAAAVLRDALPTLMQGSGAGAFHGLIRSGHALAAVHSGELARGLAYWEEAHLPLRPAAAPWPEGTLALPDWLRAVLALPRPDHPDIEKPRIMLRMAAWASAPGFDAAATGLQVDDGRATLEALARAAAGLYADTGNFTVLHALTSIWALHRLLPHAPDARQAVREHAVALAAGLRAARLTALPEAAARPEPLPWDELAAAARESHDDHLPKLVFVARAWQQTLEDAVFAQAASRIVRAQRPE